MRKWYVFDEADCFGNYDTVAEAAAQAEYLQRSGMSGIHIAHMTDKQADDYCKTGEFPFSK